MLKKYSFKYSKMVISLAALFAIIFSNLIFLNSPLLITASANDMAQNIPFTQNWANASLITADDNWSLVPGIVGYRGDDLTGYNFFSNVRAQVQNLIERQVDVK